MKNKVFLVTGAAGFIGAALANRLINEGGHVVTIDNLSTGFKSSIPKGVEFFKGDVQDETLINKLEEYKFDAIFHVAGQSSGEISFDNPVYDLQTNTQSTLLLLKLAQKTGCSNFIYASTMSVYGDQPDLPVEENQPTFPKSFYGVGKLASENYLKIYQEFGINCTALRLFNVYGPGQNMENLRQGMVSIFVAMALNDSFIHVKGSPNRFRDFVNIDDVVSAFVLSYKKADIIYDVINVCTGIKTTVGGLVNEIIGNVKGTVDYKFEGSTAGDQFGITGDNGLAFDRIGWKPTVEFKHGIKEMLNWANQSI